MPTVLELLGFLALVVGAAMLSPWAGLAVLGAGLLALGVALDYGALDEVDAP